MAQVDVYSIHFPDRSENRSANLEDMLKGINDAYKAAYFNRFGLSNYTAIEVEQVHKICKEKGYVLPTVYQGNYSAAARRVEKELFPTLRRLKIAFYVYSPIAGGLLTQDQRATYPRQGRWAFRRYTLVGSWLRRALQQAFLS